MISVGSVPLRSFSINDMDFPHIKNTFLWDALSDLAKQIYLPTGIFYWSGRAKKEAEIDATIGTAQDDAGMTCHLPSMASKIETEFFKKLTGHVFAYAPITGLQTLREKWKTLILRENPELFPYTTLPVVTSGITHGLALAGKLFLNTRETLVTYEKYWENYDQIYTAVQGVNIEPAPFFENLGFPQNLNISALINTSEFIMKKQGKLILLLNFPHNQTGFSPTEDDAQKLIRAIHEFCLKYKEKPVVVILDDAYEGFVYDDAAVQTSLAPKLFNPSIKNLTVVKLDGISKRLLAYGSRIGFFTVFLPPKNKDSFSEEESKGISEEVTNKIGACIRGDVSNANRLAQAMTEALLTEGKYETELETTISLLRERYEIMRVEISEQEKKYGRDKIRLDPFNSGFFCFFNLHPSIDAARFAEYLISEKKIGVVPAIQKRDDKILWNGIRVAFCSVPKGKIPVLIQRIYEAASSFEHSS